MSMTDSGPTQVIPTDWLEARSDLLNPILVKETRQSLKSQTFAAVFILMLVVSWLITAIGVLYLYGPELQYAAAGQQFFLAFYAVLAIAIFLIVPQGAFRSIQAERDLQTYEMLTITSLSPRHVVWGKWWSAIVQTVVFYAAIAPFMVFTNLLRGISLAVIAFFLTWSFIGSATMSMAAIACSTFTKQRQFFGILQIFLVMPLIGGLMTVLSLLANVLRQELPFDQPEFWVAQFIVLTLLIPVFILLRQIATANLMFEGSNRSTGIRITCLIILSIALSWIIVFGFFGKILPGTMSTTSIPVDGLVSVSTMIAIWLWGVGLFAVTEDDRLSRRVRKEAPKQAWTRALLLIFFPGGHRGLLYILVSVLLTWLVFYSTSLVSSGGHFDQSKCQNLLIVEASYLVFYLGVTAFLGRQIRHLGTDIQPTHVRVLGILVGAIGIIAPFLFVFWDFSILSRYPIVMITNPFWMGYLFLDSPAQAPPILFIIIPGGIGLLLNVANIQRGIHEFLTVDPTPNAVAQSASRLVSDS